MIEYQPTGDSGREAYEDGREDERKLMGVKAITIIGIMCAFAVYQKRLRWSVLKSRKIVVDVVN